MNKTCTNCKEPMVMGLTNWLPCPRKGRPQRIENYAGDLTPVDGIWTSSGPAPAPTKTLLGTVVKVLSSTRVHVDAAGAIYSVVVPAGAPYPNLNDPVEVDTQSWEIIPPQSTYDRLKSETEAKGIAVAPGSAEEALLYVLAECLDRETYWLRKIGSSFGI